MKKPGQLPDALRQLSLLLPVCSNIREHWHRDGVEEKFSKPFPRTTFSLATETAIPDWASMTIGKPSQNENIIFIAPGSVWPTKMWTESGFAQVAKSIQNRGMQAIFVGSPGERELCDKLARVTGAQTLAGQTTIPELIDLFRTGTALVANDSGAMHAASVAGLPTVSIFGPTVLEFGFRPWQNRAAVVQVDLKCRPCAAHGGKRCPIGTHACMRNLNAREVERALDLTLAVSSTRTGC